LLNKLFSIFFFIWLFFDIIDMDNIHADQGTGMNRTNTYDEEIDITEMPQLEESTQKTIDKLLECMGGT
jgi:hypothetical protein